MICRLCLSNDDLRESHIIPKFIFRWMKETSGGSFLRNAENVNVRYQDGLKMKLFCQNCEKKLNVGETYFSNTIFHPYLQKGIKEFEYDDKLFYFVISMLWRVLLLNMELLENSNINNKERFLQAEDEWRKYLLGQATEVENSNTHIVFNEITTRNKQPTENYNRYMTRATDAGLLYTSSSAIVYSKFSKFMLFGKLVEPPNTYWENTSINTLGGKISSNQKIVDPQIYDYLLTRATELHETFRKNTSNRQKEMIRKWGHDNIEKFTKSELFKVLEADYGEKVNNKHFGRNDLCPCGSNKKYKYCHGR